MIHGVWHALVLPWSVASLLCVAVLRFRQRSPSDSLQTVFHLPCDRYRDNGSSVSAGAEAELAQAPAPKAPAPKTRAALTPSISRRTRALAVVAYHFGNDSATSIPTLRLVLGAIRRWSSCDSTVYLVANRFVDGLEGMVDKQLITPSPRCSPSVSDKLCLPWVAVTALRSASTGGAPSTDFGWPLRGSLAYDAYAYLEGDMVVPVETFDFWRLHADPLYRRHFLLVPLRTIKSVKTGMSTVSKEGFEDAKILRDDDGNASLYPAERYRFYIKPKVPYSAMFLLSRVQFRDYLAAGLWDYDVGMRYGNWPLRENAASGLYWAPNLGVRKRTITHLKMLAWHRTFHKSMKLPWRILEEKVDRCLSQVDANDVPCESLDSISVNPKPRQSSPNSRLPGKPRQPWPQGASGGHRRRLVAKR